MFDLALRPIKDVTFHRLSHAVPRVIAPLHITGLGFCCGLAACTFAAGGRILPSVVLWLLNRAMDCLDGAVARARGQQSDLGGFLDLLCDFVVYSLIPVCCGLGRHGRVLASSHAARDFFWDSLAVMLLEASFYINNFVLFFAAAVLEKAKAKELRDGNRGRARKGGSAGAVAQLTSVAMRPALIEGFEAGVFFTFMFSFPSRVGLLSWLMLAGVIFGTAQRVRWLASALS